MVSSFLEQPISNFNNHIAFAADIPDGDFLLYFSIKLKSRYPSATDTYERRSGYMSVVEQKKVTIRRDETMRLYSYTFMYT